MSGLVAAVERLKEARVAERLCIRSYHAGINDALALVRRHSEPVSVEQGAGAMHMPGCEIQFDSPCSCCGALEEQIKQEVAETLALCSGNYKASKESAGYQRKAQAIVENIRPYLRPTTQATGRDEGILAELEELDFEGDRTRLVFSVPHGSSWTAGTYRIAPTDTDPLPAAQEAARGVAVLANRVRELESRLAHSEQCLKAAMAQIETDAEIMFEGAPRSRTDAEARYEEYRRVHGIGRKS